MGHGWGTLNPSNGKHTVDSICVKRIESCGTNDFVSAHQELTLLQDLPYDQQSENVL
jgi:hypothetical protein